MALKFFFVLCTDGRWFLSTAWSPGGGDPLFAVFGARLVRMVSSGVRIHRPRNMDFYLSVCFSEDTTGAVGRGAAWSEGFSRATSPDSDVGCRERRLRVANGNDDGEWSAVQNRAGSRRLVFVVTYHDLREPDGRLHGAKVSRRPLSKKVKAASKGVGRGREEGAVGGRLVEKRV